MAHADTPLMKQYYTIKREHPGALLLFRVGDFYETFGEDAVKAARILDITLTKRGNGSAAETALAGFPYHALDNYLPRLVRAGERVAICDQLEDPKFAKGIVKRGVTELVTPGVSFNDQVLEKRRNNYLAAVAFGKGEAAGIAFLDITTGEFLAAQGDRQYVGKLIQSFQPAEILVSKPQRAAFVEYYGPDHCLHAMEDWAFQPDSAYDRLTQHFRTTSLKGFGVENLPQGIAAAGAVLQYLHDNKHRELHHISGLARLEEDKYVWLDRFTIRNLELTDAQHPEGVPLITVLDHTLTPMGARLLRKWVVLPLKDVAQIKRRQDTVGALVADPELLEELTLHLRQVNDLERLISKVAVRRVNPRELLLLARSLDALAPVKERLMRSPVPVLQKTADQLLLCELIREEIKTRLRPDAPLLTNAGGLIADGVHPRLDELRKLAFSGKDYLLSMQQRETQATGISSLKVAYNKVFGYYLEVSNAHKAKVPPQWTRKQTLVNAERYITEELKEYEEKILNAEEELFALEQQVFTDLVSATVDYVGQIQQNARALAVIDCLVSFAEVARRFQYVKPVVNDERILTIRAGRHPVIERQLPAGEQYVPNDVHLNPDEQQVIIITGPNMAGKSALLRQTALIALLAQIGSFVPAQEATVGIVDKIFTRVGASDNLSRGESTFMVEMTETASILNNLSDRSLVLMDEIGRGTSTYDGISIAWAIVEHLHNAPRARARTLFATHYHELNQLADDLPRVRNFNVSVREAGGKVLFLRKLQPGGSEHSFGIHVARLAGMPAPVVARAAEIMHHLEQEKVTHADPDSAPDHNHGRPSAGVGGPKTHPTNYAVQVVVPPAPADPALQRVREVLDAIEINALTPVAALLKINELQHLLRQEAPPVYEERKKNPSEA